MITGVFSRDSQVGLEMVDRPLNGMNSWISKCSSRSWKKEGVSSMNKS